jgi:hypothetical protein
MIPEVLCNSRPSKALHSKDFIGGEVMRHCEILKTQDSMGTESGS